jgi:hypothetical protein
MHMVKRGKVYLRTGHVGPEGEETYNSTLSLTSVLDRVGGQRHPSAALCPANRLGTHSVGGWVGFMACLDGCGKSRLYRNSIPRPSSQ